MADLSKPDTTDRQQPTQGASSKMNEQDHNHHDGLTITGQQARTSIHPARPQQGNNHGWGRFLQQNERGHGPTHQLGAMDRQPGLTTGGRMGEIMDWSNLARPNEETTMHPNKPISRGNNYFSQSGGEATKPNPTQFLDIILGLAFNYQILR